MLIAFVFPMIMTLISLAALVLIVMFIVRGASQSQRTRKEAFEQALARGIYDRSLLMPRSKGIAPLGWGIFFAAIGIAMLIGFAALDILAEGATGALIPLFVGIGLIVYYMITKHLRGEDTNSEPIRIEPAGTVVSSVREEGPMGG